MSITAIEYILLRDLAAKGAFPAKADFIEFGEANWYGDVPLTQLHEDIRSRVPDPAEQDRLIGETIRLDAAYDADPNCEALFEIAKIFYGVFLNHGSHTAIDFHGTARALKLDLNRPLELGRQFDFAFNFGTGEHVFDVCQFFRTVHEVTKPGGIMIHGGPFTGWLDHGFYNIQPTLYHDIARTNGYRVAAMLLTEVGPPPRMTQVRAREHVLQLAESGEIGDNLNLYAVLQKDRRESEFAVPMQGYYEGGLSDEAAEAWRNLR